MSQEKNVNDIFNAIDSQHQIFFIVIMIKWALYGQHWSVESSYVVFKYTGNRRDTKR